MTAPTSSCSSGPVPMSSRIFVEPPYRKDPPAQREFPVYRRSAGLINIHQLIVVRCRYITMNEQECRPHHVIVGALETEPINLIKTCVSRGEFLIGAQGRELESELPEDFPLDLALAPFSATAPPICRSVTAKSAPRRSARFPRPRALAGRGQGGFQTGAAAPRYRPADRRFRGKSMCSACVSAASIKPEAFAAPSIPLPRRRATGHWGGTHDHRKPMRSRPVILATRVMPSACFSGSGRAMVASGGQLRWVPCRKALFVLPWPLGLSIDRREMSDPIPTILLLRGEGIPTVYGRVGATPTAARSAKKMAWQNRGAAFS
jgi:hypothetical protein